MRFNLVDQPWIPVVERDRSISIVSLVDLFGRWGNLLDIQAESPPATYSVYRLLLVILHRAYGGPTDADHWRSIWRDNGKEVIAYLERWRDRFDLLDPDRPFMQDPALPPESAAPFYVALHNQPDATPAHFCGLNRFSGYQPTPEAIARCIVRLQHFDLAGLKTSYPGRTGVSSATAPPLVNAANVLVRGNSLRETLCLNLAPYEPVAGDRPGWEIDDHYTGEPRKAVVPTGPLHYRTMPWRRIRWAQGKGIVVTPGDSLAADVDLRTLEPAIAWRRDEKQGIRPVRISGDRALWRDAHAFLCGTDSITRPAILDWVSELATAGLAKAPLGLTIFGWSADKAKSLGWHQESLAVPPTVLRDPSAWSALGDAIQWADTCGQTFRSFRGSPYGKLAEELRHPDAAILANSCGGARLYWARLGAQIPSVMAAIESNSFDPAEWRREVRLLAKTVFAESVAAIQDRRAKAIAARVMGWWLFKKLEEDAGE